MSGGNSTDFQYWMVLEPSEVSVCLQHPGFEVDLTLTVDTATLYRVYLGRTELAGALRARKLAMSGPKAAAAPNASSVQSTSEGRAVKRE